MEIPIVTYTDCLDPGFGYENKDGYVRIWDRPKPEGGTLVMRHRWFWELQKGPIPKGYEINHLCKNRRCCNIEHLECIEGGLHASKSNRERYLEEYLKFKQFYYLCGEDSFFTQKEWGERFDRSQACISKWVKRYHKEKQN
ncbi:MAG: HNH endonuclease [Variovorax paradoxus]|uniref:HNH endonuclease n=1 Tax=Variovorax paradoxus TaxID=34073 RepID=A0A2W5STE8_VARPD|nr:MAG: HNH endonuclease [Variovorax paradoxus]